MDDVDPAKKQYLMLAAIITLIGSFLLNFFFFELVKDTFVYGFPIGLKDATGAGDLMARIVNAIVFFIVFVFPVYFGLMWVVRRGSGGGEY